MEKVFKCTGTCSRNVVIDVEDGVVKSTRFVGGCHGNTQGISALVAGMPVKDVVEKLKGIDCGGRGSSCPDQLAKALEEFIE